MAYLYEFYRSASVFFGEREVQEDNNGKLNPSHSCGAGPSRSQGHGRPWFFQHHLTDHMHNIKIVAEEPLLKAAV